MSDENKELNDAPDTGPDFTFTPAELPMDYRSDWLCELARENSDRILSTNECDNDYLTLESVQYIFTVCVRLRLPHDIRYLAVLVFARFMRIHTVQVFGFLSNLRLSEKRRRHEWEKVEANLSRQTTLRMLSSIQIASKALSYHDSLSSKQVCSCLRSLGFAYTQQAALKSELRILKTLNFRLPRSPLTYSETLLKIIGCYWPNIDYKSIWEHILLFLDVVFLHHDQVYEVALKVAGAGNSASLPRKIDIERVKADWMLLGEGVVVAASTCVLREDQTQQMMRDLSNLCGTEHEDIAQMATAIIETTVMLQSMSACEAGGS